LKDIIISGGENISSVEIEGILHKHEAVSLAAVVALPDDKWGEVPCAFLELLEGAEVSEQEIELFCRAHLASYKRPKKIIFGELPKTATGKIQKYELRALARSGNVK
ncbi:MAG: acyl-CoA synthetase, partial [Porticoccaceae bacterium]|nr:acyl-CoA synthetase [Porticoccaceae bacterium]